MMRVDLNCDLGEGAGSDELLMPLVTSANIACGGHAGDERSMRDAVRLALTHRANVGAHPSYDDRAHFGRRELAVPLEEVVESVKRQVTMMQRLAREEGATLHHVKPHGALYNVAARDESVAIAVVDAVRQVDESLVFVGLAGSVANRVARGRGLRAVDECFADRAYRADGSLAPRSEPGAVIESEADAVAQVIGMVRYGQVRAIDGSPVAIRADTVCVHGDGSSAVRLLRGIRVALGESGVVIERFA